MPQSPLSAPRPLQTYRALIFDVYGTLVDWETGIYEALLPLFLSSSTSSTPWDRKSILSTYIQSESSLQEAHPTMPYSELLTAVYVQLAQQLSVTRLYDTKWKRDGLPVEDAAKEFGEGIKNWPVFPDTVDALRRLSKHFKLVVLSNVDRKSFLEGTLPALSYRDSGSNSDTLRSPFSLILTAQDVGAYKPSTLGFERALREVAPLIGLDNEQEQLDTVKGAVLSTAQSLYHDHAPVNKLGLGSVWIDRAGAFMGLGSLGGRELEESVRWGWSFKTLGEMADEVEREAGEAEK